ncbi:MAG: hypothetical protein V1928_05730 [Parcubacteria group bacterium]
MRKKNQSSLPTSLKLRRSRKLRLTRLPIKRMDSCAEIQTELKNFRADKGLTLLERYEVYKHLMKCDGCIEAYSKLMEEDSAKLRAKLKHKFS